MIDYSKYEYRRMLSYIEERCKELNDDRDYIGYILSMENAESIEKLIKMYGSCYRVLAYLFFGKKNLPMGWYRTGTWGYHNEWIIEELNYCLNENILKWYKRQKKLSNEEVLKCIANLRDASNAAKIHSEIITDSKPRADRSIWHFTHVIHSYYKLRKAIESGIYTPLERTHYISHFRYLAAHGHILDVAEISFCKKEGIKYDNLLEEYEIEKEQTTKRELEQMEAEKEAQKCFNTTTNVNMFKAFDEVGDLVFSALLAIPFGFLGAIFSSIGRRR